MQRQCWMDWYAVAEAQRVLTTALEHVALDGHVLDVGGVRVAFTGAWEVWGTCRTARCRPSPA